MLNLKHLKYAIHGDEINSHYYPILIIYEQASPIITSERALSKTSTAEGQHSIIYYDK